MVRLHSHDEGSDEKDLIFPSKIPMSKEKKSATKEPRRPILTRKEQAILAFILALLVVGGIVRKLRTDWGAIHPPPVQKS